MSAPRRLCVVNPFQHGGGAEFQIHCLLDMLNPRSSYDVSYLARHIDPESRGSYRVVPIGNGGAAPRLGYLMDAIPLYAALRSQAPDVIYQRVAGGYTAVCAYYARRHRVPLIWHVAHDSDVTPQALTEGRNPIRPFIEKRSVEYAIRRADYIVVQKQQQRDLLMKHYGRDADLIVLNVHPVPNEVLDKSGPTRVLWIANLKRWKQPEVFVRLAAALSELRDVRFTMIGASPDGAADAPWRAELLHAIAATPNLDYAGHKSHAEVNELLARSHLFVNTSLHEGFPNTFIQAWMRGVPVLSLHVDPDDVLSRQHLGARANSEPELIRLARDLLTDAERRVEMGARARAYAVAHHSIENAAPLLQLIGSCVARVPR